MKSCIYNPNKLCDSCGDCKCELNPQKICDNCEKCLGLEGREFIAYKLKGVIFDEDDIATYDPKLHEDENEGLSADDEAARWLAERGEPSQKEKIVIARRKIRK